MENEFVPYQQSLELEELGFDEPCLAHLIGFGDGTTENGRYKINQQQVFYPNDYTTSDDKAEELGLYPFGMCGVPLFQQAFRWFREKHNLKSCIMFRTSMEDSKEYYDWLIKGQEVLYRHFKNYEEAELACLIKLIEIVKDADNTRTSK